MARGFRNEPLRPSGSTHIKRTSYFVSGTMALRVADRLLSEHHCVINQVLAVFLDEEHLSDKLTGRLGQENGVRNNFAARGA